MQGQRSSKRPDQRLLQGQAFRHMCTFLNLAMDAGSVIRAWNVQDVTRMSRAMP